MADPLEYESRDRRPTAEPVSDDVAPPEAPPAVAVPAEFDHCLTRSDDHGGVAAIEAALRARRIPCFRADGGGYAKRQIALHIRGQDAAAAGPIAAQIFARRQKLRSFPRQQVRRDEDDRPHWRLPRTRL